MQISLEPFDSQPTGVVASLNEDYLFESNGSTSSLGRRHIERRASDTWPLLPAGRGARA